MLRAKPRTFRVTSRGVEGVETRMVGREAELLYLQDAFQCMQEEREGSIITIVGEAGIGKSRLLYEFQNWLEFQKIDIRLFLGRALQEQQQTPFALLHDVFSFHCQIQESDPLETVHQKIESCFGEIIGTEKTSIVRSHFIGQLLGFDFTDSPHLTGLLENPQHLHERAIAYLNEYFQVLANQYPIVIFLEDIHWADDSSLDLINQISPLTSKNPLLIICLARPNLYQQRPNWGEGLDYHHKLELSALNKRESRSLVGEILKKVDQVPVALRELVVSWAEGNPFYIEELIKMLIENGVILTGAEHWRVIPDQLAQVNVPATLTGVLQARLDGLPDSEHVSLRLAAVVGRIFWEEAIYYMLEKLNSQETMVKGLELSAALTSLREHELIYRREGSTFAETNEYLFKHALLRDVAYENIPKRERRAYHKLTADWLRETTSSTNRSDEYSAQIAEHYYLANERDSAIEWLFRAGLRAKKQDAMREARSYLSRALDLMPVEDLDRRWQILLERDEILGIVGEQDARLAEDDELVRIAEATNDKNKVAEAYYRKGYFLYTLGQIPASMEACEEAIDAAIQAGNRKLEILATGIVIVNHKTLGEIEAATEKAEYVLGIADGHLDDHTFASTLGNLGMIYENLDIQKAIQLYERSIEISDRSGNHYFKAVGLLNIGYIYIMAGHADRGVKALKTALDLNESIGSPRTTIYNLLNLGLAYYHFGDYHAATESLKKAESAIKDREDPIAVAYCNNYLGLVAEQSLTASVARQFFQKAFELFNQIGSMGYAKDAAAGMARTALSMDNLAEAQAGAVEVWEYLSSKGPKGMEFPVLAFLTCAKIFQDAKDHDRMMAAINGGYDELNKRAGKFSDEDWRNTYLHAITEHAAMLEMWQQYHGEL